MSDSEKLIHTLDQDADHALFSGAVHGLAVTIYANERPLAGLSGLLDWRFQGAFSDYIRAGAITGATGQCIYVPVTRNEQTYHIVLLGTGYSSSPGLRQKPPAEALELLHKNLLSLKLPKIGLSRADFGEQADEFFSRNLKGVPLWILR